MNTKQDRTLLFQYSSTVTSLDEVDFEKENVDAGSKDDSSPEFSGFWRVREEKMKAISPIENVILSLTFITLTVVLNAFIVRFYYFSKSALRSRVGCS